MIFLIIAIFFRIVINPMANVFQKKLTVNLDPLFVNFLSYFLISILLIVPASQFSWQQFSSEFWIFSVLTGIFGALGNGFLVRALQLGELSVLGPINAYKSVVSMLLGIVLLKEMPGIWGIFGVLLIIAGSYFVLDASEEKFSFRLFQKKEIQFRLLALLFTAIEALFLKKVIIASDPFTGLISWSWFGCIFSFLVLLLLQIPVQKSFKKINKESGILLIGLIICAGLTQFSTNYIFEKMQVGLALALFQLSILVTIFFGYRFFQEKNMMRKMLGAIIMIAGSVLIILLNK